MLYDVSCDKFCGQAKLGVKGSRRYVHKLEKTANFLLLEEKEEEEEST